MTEHHALIDKFAVHPAAFMQNTDPALEPAKLVAKRKWWIDTGNGNALKVRNETNTDWITVLAGSGQAVGGFVEINWTTVLEEATGGDLDSMALTLITYL